MDRICWQKGKDGGSDFWFENDSQIVENINKACLPYKNIPNSEFPRYYSNQLPNISKSECFGKLSKEKYEFDYALPQTWLDEFVKKTRLKYDLVLSTTVWVYKRHSFESFPISCCVEVQREIEKEYS